MILPTLLGDILVLGTARRGWRLARPAWAFVVSAVVASVPAAAALNFLPGRTVALMAAFLTVAIACLPWLGGTSPATGRLGCHLLKTPRERRSLAHRYSFPFAMLKGHDEPIANC